jgi:hypothetical protein
MHPTRYRTRLLLDFTRGLLFPAAILTLALQLTGRQLGLLTVPCYALFILAWSSAKIQYADLVQSQQARQLGARPITRVVGRWPGNIDILLRMMQAAKTGYIFDVYLDLFKEYQCTTLNTRILCVDHVGIHPFSSWGLALESPFAVPGY